MFHQEMEYGFFLAANYPWSKSSMIRGFAGRVFLFLVTQQTKRTFRSVFAAGVLAGSEENQKYLLEMVSRNSQVGKNTKKSCGFAGFGRC